MFGRYRHSPAVVTNPALLNAPQLMVDPQDPNDPLGEGAYGEVGFLGLFRSKAYRDEARAARARKRRQKAQYLESIGKDKRADRLRRRARRIRSKIGSEGIVVGSVDALTGEVIPAWYNDTNDFLEAVEDRDASKTFGAMKRLHTGMHAGTYGDFESPAAPAVPEGAGIVIGNLNDGYFRKFGATIATNPAMLTSPMADFGSNLGNPSDVAYGVEGTPDDLETNGIVIGNLNDGYFRKFGTANITNPAMLVSPMADFGPDIGDPSDVAYGVGEAGDEDDDDLFGPDVFFNKEGKLRGRHRTKHLAKKSAVEGRKAIKEMQRGLRQAERGFERVERRFERAEEDEPSYADESREADKVIAKAEGLRVPRLWRIYAGESNSPYGPFAASGEIGALDGEAAFAEASRILDVVGLRAEDGPGDSASVSFESERQLRRSAGAILIAAERMSQEPMWLYADGDTLSVALSLEPFPDGLGWTLVGVANGADPEAEAGDEAGAFYYGTANITNPAMLTSPMADFDEDLGSPFSVRY